MQDSAPAGSGFEVPTTVLRHEAAVSAGK